MDLEEMWSEDVNWIKLANTRDGWRGSSCDRINEPSDSTNGEKILC
jgi:hypothetical protein